MKAKACTMVRALFSTAIFVTCTVYSGFCEAFHAGTIGQCEGCHFLEGGSGEAIGYSALRGGDASSTCLRCHQAPLGAKADKYFIATDRTDLVVNPPSQLTPGGDFGWLKKTYRWKDESGADETSEGSRHGHNIVAIDYDYVSDSRHAMSPAGRYPSAQLSCISCHDPHGNYRRNWDGSITSSGATIISSGSYSSSPIPKINESVGSYRLLAGKGYSPKNVAGAELFQYDPPTAVAPDSYNRSEAVTETRVAYGSGMSEWCQNCHREIHTNNESQHVSGNNAKLSREIMDNYNSYVKSGDLNGSPQKAYSSLVPYEMGTNDYRVLKAAASNDGSKLGGPGTLGDSPNVMCLSCHRAHASGWDSMTRWNVDARMLVVDGHYPSVNNRAGSDNAQGRTEADVRQAYYDRPASSFATYQRSLCNKCHAKD